MWQVSYFDPNTRKWFYLANEEDKPRRFRTHDEAYHEMISLQKEGFEAYTEKV